MSEDEVKHALFEWITTKTNKLKIQLPTSTNIFFSEKVPACGALYCCSYGGYEKNDKN